jgi:hypothetical protein
MGLVGHITKGVALGTVGDLLGYAALTFEQSKARWAGRGDAADSGAAIRESPADHVGLGFVASAMGDCPIAIRRM